MAAIYGCGLCLAGIAGYFGVGPYCDSVTLVSLALPRWTSLRTASVQASTWYTARDGSVCDGTVRSLSIGTCVHVVWSGRRAVPSLSQW